MRPIWRNDWATIRETTRLSNETYETTRETREEYSGNKRLPLYDFRFFSGLSWEDTWSLVKIILLVCSRDYSWDYEAIRETTETIHEAGEEYREINGYPFTTFAFFLTFLG